MFGDSWRLLRDYFYDKNMHGVDWVAMFHKYRAFVDRCTHREELDDVFKHMAAELSALHVFVYGGEYRPVSEDKRVLEGAEVGSLCVDASRTEEGYTVEHMYEIDPHFPTIDDKFRVVPLSHQFLRRTGQRGLRPGDRIVAIDGVPVLAVPDLNYLLTGKVNRGVKVDVKRASGDSDVSSSVFTRAVSNRDCSDIKYASWEYRTRQKAVRLASEAGFSMGYIHMRSMSGAAAEDQFVRGYFRDFDKQGMIVDVRDNRGGSIDSWLLDVFSKKAWMFWQSRTANITNGGLGHDQLGAFMGAVVVLTNEQTASDGEGFSRGMKTLGLAKLVGTR